MSPELAHARMSSSIHPRAEDDSRVVVASSPSSRRSPTFWRASPTSRFTSVDLPTPLDLSRVARSPRWRCGAATSSQRPRPCAHGQDVHVGHGARTRARSASGGRRRRRTSSAGRRPTLIVHQRQVTLEALLVDVAVGWVRATKARSTLAAMTCSTSWRPRRLAREPRAPRLQCHDLPVRRDFTQSPTTGQARLRTSRSILPSRRTERSPAPPSIHATQATPSSMAMRASCSRGHLSAVRSRGDAGAQRSADDGPGGAGSTCCACRVASSARRGPGRGGGAAAVRSRLLEPHVPGSLRLARGRRAARPAGGEHQERARHGARAPHPLRAGPVVEQGAASAGLLRRRRGHRHAVLRDGARERRGSSARRCPRGSTPIRRRMRTVSDGRCATPLAEIHNLDWKACRPGGDLGLSDGYVERQVRGRAERYKKARTNRDAPQVEKLGAWLEEQFVGRAGGRRSLQQYDFKYDNVVPLVGDLDARLWRCSTGRWPPSATCFMDLVGTALGYWIEPDDPPVFQITVFGPTNRPGNLTRVEFAERWSRATGRDASDVLFYYAFALFKLAVTRQQLYKRWVDGLHEGRPLRDDAGRRPGRGDSALVAVDKGRIDRPGE